MLTIQNIDKSVGYNLCGSWYITNARVIAGYYIWEVENTMTSEKCRIVLRRWIEPGNRLNFIHFGDHAGVKTDIALARLSNMKTTMHKLADELYWAEQIF